MGLYIVIWKKLQDAELVLKTKLPNNTYGKIQFMLKTIMAYVYTQIHGKENFKAVVQTMR